MLFFCKVPAKYMLVYMQIYCQQEQSAKQIISYAIRLRTSIQVTGLEIDSVMFFNKLEASISPSLYGEKNFEISAKIWRLVTF